MKKVFFVVTAALGVSGLCGEGDKVVVRWAPSTDNLVVRYYELLRAEDGGLKPVTLATSNQMELPSAQCPPGTYAVRAVDVADNASQPSGRVELRR